MFKYFDQQNAGSVNCEQFVRVLEKTGMYYPLPTLQALFSEYDVDQSGAIDYRELALMISGEHKIKSWTPCLQPSIPSEK
jgi:Ca2+-binding EF-hand superfamily protein